MAMYCEESGNKTASTVVFIHGGGISGWMWGKQVDFFKDYSFVRNKRIHYTYFRMGRSHMVSFT